MLPFTLAEIIAIAQGAVYLLVTVIALLRQKVHPRSARVLVLYALLSIAWLLAQLALGKNRLPFLMDDFVARLPLYGLLLMSVVFLWFARVFQRVEGAGWGWWILGVAWIGLILLVDSNLLTQAQVLWTGGGWMILRSDFVLSGIGLGWCVFIGAATMTTLQHYRYSQQPLQRNRSRYLAAVILFILVGEATFLAAYWTLGGLVRLAGVLLAAYAALTVRLPSFRRALLRSLSYLITTGLALLFYLGALLGARWVFGTSAYPPRLLAGLLAVALAVLFNPLLNQAQRWIDRLIAGVSHDPRRVLRQYSQTISNILDLSLLAKVVIELIGGALDISQGRLFTVTHEKDPEGCNCFRLLAVRGARETHPEAATLEEASPLADYFMYHSAPLPHSDIESLPRFARIPVEERRWVASLQMELFVPIHSQDEWIGLLALGPKNSGEPFWDDDQFLLSTLADQTAVALENARLVESLIRLNNDFRRAITALDQANRNLEQLDRTKTEFISVASHELRTPLTLVNGYSQMLLDEPGLASDPIYATMLSGIRNGAQRLHEVLESMLDMARIDTRELQLDLQPVALGKIIHDLSEELESAMQERNQTFEAQDFDNLPPIQGDGEALRKVFYHLLVNAIKYTPDGGHIAVSGSAVYPSPERLIESGVEMVVSDTGVGIDPGLQEVIFTKFYQTGELALHSTGKTKFKGSGPGLGLAIAKGFVEAHFGRIWVESTIHDEGCCPGSQFHVFLPLHQPEKTRPKSIL